MLNYFSINKTYSKIWFITHIKKNNCIIPSDHPQIIKCNLHLKRMLQVTQNLG